MFHELVEATNQRMGGAFSVEIMQWYLMSDFIEGV